MTTASKKINLCELCKQKPADKTGSHFTPSSLIKPVVGDRDSEEAYSISSTTGNAKQFYGRSNLNNTNPELKENVLTKDNVFCKSCEDLFARFEAQCNNVLNNYVNALIKSDVKILRTGNGQKYFEIHKPPKQIFKYYFYSIVWRQCIEQKVMNSNLILDEENLEKLRNIIFNSEQLSDKELINMDEQQHPDFIVFTTYHKNDPTTNFFQPGIVLSNPKVFFMATYSLLYFKEGNQNNIEDISKWTGIPTSLFDTELCYKSSDEMKIGIANEDEWSNIVKQFASVVADNVIRKRFKQ